MHEVRYRETTVESSHLGTSLHRVGSLFLLLLDKKQIS
jgi:hypothetical protein